MRKRVVKIQRQAMQALASGKCEGVVLEFPIVLPAERAPYCGCMNRVGKPRPLADIDQRLRVGPVIPRKTEDGI